MDTMQGDDTSTIKKLALTVAAFLALTVLIIVVANKLV